MTEAEGYKIVSNAKLPKYRVVTAPNADLFEMRINALADIGYTLKIMNVSDDENTPLLYAVMVIAEDSYENVSNLRDVAPELVDECLEKGWLICSTSLSTKFVRMVRRKKL